MAHPRRAHFLTFVLTGIFIAIAHQPRLVYAAKAPPSPDFIEPEPESEPPSPEAEEKLQSIDVAPPPPEPPASERKAKFFYHYRHALTLRTGALLSISDGSESLGLAGANYAFYTESQNVYEIGADLASDGSGAIHGARRFIYSRSKFRPYSKLGAGVRIVPADQLATFLKYRHYMVRGAVGFEQLISGKSSTRLELEGMASPENLQAALTIGIVWPW